MSDAAAPATPGDDAVVEGFDLSDDAVLRRLVESVRTLAADPDTYETQSRFRPLRRALEPLMERYATRQGEILERARKRQLRKEAQSRASKQTHQDRLHRDNTRLRFGRIENLAALTEDGGGGGAIATLDAVAGLLADGVDGDAGGRSVAYLTQVPDGAVKDDARRFPATPGLLGTTTTDGGATSASAKEEGRRGGDAAATDAENDLHGQSVHTNSHATSLFFTSGDPNDPNDADARATGTLHTSRQCYTCKARFSKLHHFYAQFCESCAAVNWKMRGLSADLTGKVALLTGARVKIGFEIGLKLLRAGATLLATTRFPADAHRRYAAEDDFEVWRERLHVHGVDLRDVRGLEAFCAMLNETLPRLDIIVNNACQTVRRPVSYYAHLLPEERKLDALVSAAAGRGKEEGGGGDGSGGASPAVPPALAAHAERVLRDRARVARSGNKSSSASIDNKSEALTETGETDVVSSGTSGDENVHLSVGGEDADAFFPTPAQLSQLKLVAEDDVSLPALGSLDVNGQQIDLRTNNSWRLKLDEVPLPELAEVMAINAMAPFVLNARLTPLLEKSAKSLDGDKKRVAFIVNVSAMEGKFYRHKTPNHPHTNMAKAALNMMTRTSAAELAEKRRVFMTAVDTGWINDENPRHIAARIAKTHDFQTPIDEVDAAARVLHPVFHGYAPGVEPLRGVFLKDYVATEW